MSNSAPPAPKTFTASEDLTRYRFVKLGSSANEVDACDSQGEAAVGVVIEDVDASAADAASVWLLGDGGIQLIEMSEQVDVMSDITTGTDGRGEEAAADDIILGTIIEASSGAGHVVPFIPEYAERAVPGT